jgi:hypothetical protein
MLVRNDITHRDQKKQLLAKPQMLQRDDFPALLAYGGLLLVGARCGWQWCMLGDWFDTVGNSNPADGGSSYFSHHSNGR